MTAQRSVGESIDANDRFSSIFHSHLDHALLDKETEATLAKQAQSEIASWNKNLEELQLTGDAQHDLSQVMLLRAKSGNDRQSALYRLLSCNYRIMLRAAFIYRTWGAKCGYGVTDLFSLAFEGYLHAISKFDETRGVRLSTYSDAWMRQRIRRELHQNSNMIRPAYNSDITANRIKRIYTIWHTRHGRAPTDDEMLVEIVEYDRRKKLREAKAVKRALRKQARYAESSKVKPEPAKTPQKAAQELSAFRLVIPPPLSIDSMVDENGNPRDLPDNDRSGNEPVEAIDAEETSRFIKQAIARLDPIEQHIIQLRFLNESETSENLTLKEVGDDPTIGLSRERIRQIQAEALRKLRKILAHLRAA